MRPLSLYIHVPFCTRRCSYCSFFHVTQAPEVSAAFMDALEEEIFHTLAVDVPGAMLRTVFLGGGTPSVLPRESLARVFAAIRPHTGNSITEEITVELNPEDVTPDLVTFLRDQGVNRVSLGIQSMNPIAQKVLRRCPPEQNLTAIDRVRQRFDNVSFDVLIGVPGSTEEIFESTLTALAAFGPEHFSLYCLEPGGDMEHEVEKFFRAVDPERSAREYLFACQFLQSAGYEHYEVSNFCLPGRASVHNGTYWSGDEYVGVGPGAHSFQGGRRFYNLPSLDDYCAHRGAARAGRRVYDDGGAGGELERLMLGLRTAHGVPRDACACDDSTLATLSADGLVVAEYDRVRLSDSGFLMLNDLVLRLGTRSGDTAVAG